MRAIADTTWSVEDAREYIKARVKVDANGCWIWRLALAADGYGRCDVPRATRIVDATRARRAHRLAYEAFVGPIPEDTLVCHVCDVRLCCSPKHLFLGTSAENSADMAAKDRSTHGSKSASAKITESDVVKVLQMLEAGVNQQRIAEQMCVSRPLISLIKSGKRWRRVVELWARDAVTRGEVVLLEELRARGEVAP